MSFAAGTKLGPYEVLASVGRGGMGEVYRASDTRLDRSVAIKVLSSAVEWREELKSRFEREARTISKLSHPNICTLYDVGHHDGVDYLVMEFLEGETLAQRLQRGALSIEQTLKYGIEIADALQAAHRHGIVHRDLKPGNVMLSKRGAILMDFGLAKSVPRSSPNVVTSGEAAAAPTLATEDGPLTAEGVIVGTMQYMAPEQLEGRDADVRTDIFALGLILFEMATGQAAFSGSSKAKVIASILSSQPPSLSSVRPETPPAFEHLVTACLAKNPEQRFCAAQDVKLQLAWAAGEGFRGARVANKQRRDWAGWVTSAVLVIALALTTFLWWRSGNTAKRTMYFQAPLAFAVQDLALSPDGHTLAVVGYMEASSNNVIWIYDLGSRRAENVPGTEGASYPFWSADGRSVAFFADGKLKKVEVSGGPTQTIADAPAGRGGAWNKDGVILFSPNGSGGLFRISASGGTPAPVTKPDASRLEMSHRWPVFLPDGDHFIYLAANFSGHPEVNAIFQGSLSSDTKKKIVDASANAAYVTPGYLLFYRDKTLVAQRFDLRRFAISGQPTTVLGDVQFRPEVDRAVFAASDSGVLIAQGVGRAAVSQLAWFDRSGKQVRSEGKAAIYGNVGLSPDGKRAAFDLADLDSMNVDVWTMEVGRDSFQRFTFDPSLEYTPVWSPDGKQILFGSNRTLSFGMELKNADGSGQTRPIEKAEVIGAPNDWSRDGKYVLYTRGTELWYLTMPGFEGKPLVQVKAVITNGQFSPDGRWVAYASNETGRWEVYVTSFPEGQGKWQVSQGGGYQPRWRTTKELFYLSFDGRLMTVPVRSEGSFRSEAPIALFLAHPHQRVLSTDLFSYDVTADGKRFLVNTQIERPESAPVSVILDWPAQVNK